MGGSNQFVHPAERWRERGIVWSPRSAALSPEARCAAWSSKEDIADAFAMGDMTDPRSGPARYVAYLARLKILLAAKTAAAANAGLFAVTAAAGSGAARYLAFTSDVGEAMRPVVSPTVVNASYAVAGAYMLGDVVYQGYRAKGDGGNIARTCAEAATFQLLASLIIPVAVIHTAVHQSQKVFKRIKRFQKWGPSVVGLICIPLLPYTVDEPIEHGIEQLFAAAWPVERDGHGHTTEKKHLD